MHLTASDITSMMKAAELLNDQSPDLAYQLLLAAKKHRPYQRELNTKIDELADKVLVHNNETHIHLGVHKTATTYLQSHLAFKSNAYQYIELHDFRRLRKLEGFYHTLKHFDWDQPVLISDENLMGGNGSALRGKLYGDFNDRFEDFVRYFKYPEKLKIFITIRPMTSFLPSQYCEHLRWAPFICYTDFIAKVSVETLSWFTIFANTIKQYPNIEFCFFDFREFSQSGTRLLKALSFGEQGVFDPNEPKSRQSFTNEALFHLSDGDPFYPRNDQPFNPHSDSEKKASIQQYKKDISKLSSLDNVTWL